MNQIKYFIHLTFVLFLSFPAQLQTYEDSLLEIIQEDPENKEALFLLGEYLVQRKPERAMQYADQLLLQITEPVDSVDLTRVNNIYAASHRWQGNYATSLDYYEQNYGYYKRRRNKQKMAESAAKIGTINLYLGNNIIAQNYLLKSDEIYKRIGSPQQKAKSKIRLANFHLGLEHLDEAKELYEQVLKEYVSMNDSSGIATCNINLGYVLTELGELERAENHLQTSIQYCRVFPTARELGFAHDFLGLLRQAQGRLDEAYQEHMIALGIRQKLSSSYNLCESRLSVGRILIKLGEYERAVIHLNDVFSYEEHNSRNQQSSAHELLSEAYEKMGKYGMALEQHKFFKAISDSIFNTSSIEVIAEKEAQYEKKEQDTRIKLLLQEKELGEQKALRSRIITYGSVIIAIIIFSLSSFVYNLYVKVKRQKNALSTSLEEKETLLKEVHHRVKNNLQIISSLLSIQKRQIEDPAAARALEESRNRVRSIALIHQNLYQDNDLKEIDTKTFIEQLTHDLVNNYKAGSANVSLELDIDEVSLDIDTVIPIGFILNELITNAFKYAFDRDKPGVLKIQMKKKDESITIKVADNGKGLPESFSIDKSKSLGYKLIKLFSNKLNAQLTVETNGRVNGTEVQLSIPYL